MARILVNSVNQPKDYMIDPEMLKALVGLEYPVVKLISSDKAKGFVVSSSDVIEALRRSGKEEVVEYWATTMNIRQINNFVFKEENCDLLNSDHLLVCAN